MKYIKALEMDEGVLHLYVAVMLMGETYIVWTYVWVGPFETCRRNQKVNLLHVAALKRFCNTIIEDSYHNTLAGDPLHPGWLHIEVLPRYSCYSACVQL